MARIRALSGYDHGPMPAGTATGPGTFYPLDPRPAPYPANIAPATALDLAALLHHRAFEMRVSHVISNSGTGTDATTFVGSNDTIESLSPLSAKNSEWQFADPALNIGTWSAFFVSHGAHAISYNGGAFTNGFDIYAMIFQAGLSGAAAVDFTVTGGRQSYWNDPHMLQAFEMVWAIIPDGAGAAGNTADGERVDAVRVYTALDDKPWGSAPVGYMTIRWPAYWLDNEEISAQVPLYVCNEYDVASGGGAPSRSISWDIDVTVTDCWEYGFNTAAIDSQTGLLPVWAANGAALLDPITAGDHYGR